MFGRILTTVFYRSQFNKNFRPIIQKAGFKFVDGKMIWPKIAPYLHETEQYHMGSLYRDIERQNAAYRVWAVALQQVAAHANACHRDLSRAEVFRRRPEFQHKAIVNTVQEIRTRAKLQPLTIESFPKLALTTEVGPSPPQAAAAATGSFPTPTLPAKLQAVPPKGPSTPSAPSATPTGPAS